MQLCFSAFIFIQFTPLTLPFFERSLTLPNFIVDVFMYLRVCFKNHSSS